MCKVGTKTPVCANTGQNQRVSNLLFSVSSYILVLRLRCIVIENKTEFFDPLKSLEGYLCPGISILDCIYNIDVPSGTSDMDF